MIIQFAGLSNYKGINMTELDRKQIIANSWLAHNLVEQDYLSNSAVKGDDDWLEKQRILLADMALHLLQTTLTPGELRIDKLQNNIYSILTICDQFMPDAKLLEAKESIY